jgi:uncharacterized protein DUF1064
MRSVSAKRAAQPAARARVLDLDEVNVADLTNAQMAQLLAEMQTQRPRARKQQQTAAVAVQCDGHTFPSKAERDAYLRLREDQAQGRISDLTLQPRFVIAEGFTDPLDGRKYPPLHYTADFQYQEPAHSGIWWVYEVKGRIFRDYPLRRHLFRQRYPYLHFVEQRTGRKRRR